MSDVLFAEKGLIEAGAKRAAYSPSDPSPPPHRVSPDLELTNWTGQQALGILFLPLQVWDYWPLVCMWALGSDLEPHAYKANPFLTGPPHS